MLTDLVDSLLRGDVSAEMTPDNLACSTGGAAGRERARPPDKPPSLLETGGAVPATDTAVVQHLPAPQPQVAANLLTPARQTQTQITSEVKKLFEELMSFGRV